MYISSLRREDHAYYQVVLKDPQTRITEVTDIWLNIIGMFSCVVQKVISRGDSFSFPQKVIMSV